MSGGILGMMGEQRGTGLLGGVEDILDPNSPSYSRRHGGSVITGLLDSLYSGVTLPRDVYQGKVDLNTDEGTGRVLDMAGTAMTGGLGGAPAGAVGSGPFRAYHGSPAMDLSELRPSTRGPLGPGVYLTPDNGLARRYAGADGRVYEAELNDTDLFQGVKSRDSSVNPYQVWRDQTAKLVSAAEPEMQQQVAELATRMDPSDGYPFFVRLSQLLGSTEKAQELIKRAGYKGMSGNVDGHEILMFDQVPVGQRQ